MNGSDGFRLAWRKSSLSGAEGGTCVEIATAWCKSSRSDEQGGTCVEVAAADAPAERTIFVRDSKDPGGAVLSFSVMDWAVFAHDLKRGRYGCSP